MQTMAGHILRVHPESIPHIVDRILNDATQVALVEQEAAREPELWRRLISYMVERRRERVREVLS